MTFRILSSLGQTVQLNGNNHVNIFIFLPNLVVKIFLKTILREKHGCYVFSTLDIAQEHIYIIIVFLVIKINKLTEMSRS